MSAVREDVDREANVTDVPNMVHILSHFDGGAMVALCGYRKVSARLRPSSTLVDCIVCAEIDEQERGA